MGRRRQGAGEGKRDGHLSNDVCGWRVSACRPVQERVEVAQWLGGNQLLRKTSGI